MNTQSIKHNIEIIANVGVLFGIILLAYEVNQNNELLAAEARTRIMDNRTLTSRRVADNPTLVDLRLRATNQELLTRNEEYRLRADVEQFLDIIEWEWEQYNDGILENESISALVNRLISLGNREPYRMRYFEEQKENFSPDFVAFMEENVISQLE